MSLKQVSIASFFTKSRPKPRASLALEPHRGTAAACISRREEGTEEAFPQRREAHKSPPRREETESLSSHGKLELLRSSDDDPSHRDAEQSDRFGPSEVGLDLVKSVNLQNCVCRDERNEMEREEIVRNELHVEKVNAAAVPKLTSENHLIEDHICTDTHPMQSEMERAEIIKNESNDETGNATFSSKLRSQTQCDAKRKADTLSKPKRVRKAAISKDEEERNEPLLPLEEESDNSTVDANSFAMGPSSGANSTTEYERAREENLRRNRVVLEKLGISSLIFFTNDVNVSSNLKPKALAKRKTTVCSSAHPSPLPLRRSRRLLRDDSVELDVNTGILVEPAERQKASSIDQDGREDTILCYDDSSILKYACGETMDAAKFNLENGYTKSELDSGKIGAIKAKLPSLELT